MTSRSRAETATGRRAELPFGVALGHQLRRVREENGQTAAQVAHRAGYIGLRWDRSTVARIELGQRQVTAGELLLLTVLFDRPLSALLPTEAVRLNDVATATPTELAEVLTRSPDSRGWHFEGLLEAVQEGLERLRGPLKALEARLPGATAIDLIHAASHMREETTTKAARRLDATAEEVAVAAVMLWERSLPEERDRRVEALGPTNGVRAKQARRGHVTRALLEELRPQVLRVRGEEV